MANARKLRRALLGAVRGTSFGRLVSSASGRASLPLRHEMLSLAGVQSEQLRGTTATVWLRFTEAARGESYARLMDLAGTVLARRAPRRRSLSRRLRA